MRIRNIGELAALVAGDGSPNYKSGPKLIELFNEFGFNDEYITPGIGISTVDLGQGLSRNPYAKKRLSILLERGQLGEFLNLYLSSVEDFDYAKSKIDAIIAKNDAIERYTAVVGERQLTPVTLGSYVSSMETKKRPCLFISYSWDNEEHKRWVRKMADDLQREGFEVLLDQYLPFGASLSIFMIDGIRNADKVLIVGTSNYKEKAESHKGGATIEDQIVNIHLGRQCNTIKFIPILREGTFASSFTDLVSDRLGLDFRDDDSYEDRLKELVSGLRSNESFDN